MKNSIWPKSVSGICACVLSSGFVVLIFLRYRTDMQLPKSAIAVVGVMGFLAGVISYIKNDRGAGVIYSLLIGLVLIFWIIVELYFPC